MKVLIFMREDKLTPRGGPYAVGYYINEERKKCGDEFIEFLPSDEVYNRVHMQGRKLTNKLPKWMNNLHRSVRRAASTYQCLFREPKENTFDFSEYDIIHFHQTIDMYKQRGNLKNYKGIVVITSHSPIPFHQEHYMDLPKLEHKLFIKIYDKTVEMDRYAFKRADYIFFPCEEAEEPYLNNWDEFATIVDEKREKFRYILTGIPEAKAIKTREEVCTELGIEKERFIISYVGRHNKVKGYGCLLKIGKKILSNHQDVEFVIAGRETPMQGLKHKRWHEIGWTTDPHSYIAASDIFVLPNEATYFDIVMLEVLSLGCIVVASRTGGNKHFEKHGVEGIFLFDTENEAVEQIEKIKNLSTGERDRLRKINKKYYEENLTSGVMYQEYVKLLNTIYRERIDENV